MKILLLDNFDSFTFNLYQLAREVFGDSVHVLTNDSPRDALYEGGYDAAIVSPGPGRPERPADFGLSREVLESLGVPTLGVCLGHQGLCHLYGGRIVHAPEPMHGRRSEVLHDGSALFEGIPNPFLAVRYHSLMCAQPLPAELELTAWTRDGIAMAVQHRTLPQWGVQFHPESVCTEHGRTLLINFRRLCESRGRRRAGPTRPTRSFTPVPSEPLRDCRRLSVRKLPRRLADEDIFERLYGDCAYAFWLDSSHPDVSRARFSFMGGQTRQQAAALRFSLAGGRLESIRGDSVAALPGDVLEHLQRSLRSVEVAGPDRPFDFAGGYVGYLGYELKALCGGKAAHESPHPDAYLMDVSRFVAIDRIADEVWLVFVESDDDRDASAWFDRTEAALGTAAARPASGPPSSTGHFEPALGHDEYLERIAQSLTAIRDGESYEICLTTALCASTDADPFELYKVLRRRNPAPYSAFLRFPELSIACSSPERFLKLTRDRFVESKPIKGTLRRGLNAREDAALRQLLGEDEKSRAENLMIVDLLRNDLGRVCDVGSVSVPHLMSVEAYATVHQLVSTIRGHLRADLDVVDLVRAAFPGGSMTGAPKIRTMSIIDSLEGRARGPYSGTIGFLSLDGSADLNIVIRTAVFAGGRTTIGVGGAIVAMSDPEEEWREILLKGRGLVAAFEDLGRTEPDRGEGRTGAPGTR